uniref:Mono-and diacylglycerol lipase n=1 Tax=Talaromyces marneffei PM1 TaxID=1077442 RepID=A0A093V726_TALMA
MILFRFITAVAALTATATAGLLRRADVVSSTVLARLSLIEQYSAAAYCTKNDIAAPGTPIACAPGNCPTVEQDLATVSFSFLKLTGAIACSKGDGGDTGFIAADIANSFLFSPSVALGALRMVSLSSTPGSWDSWDPVSARITTELTNAQVATGFTTLIVTGHGVGGALATLAATRFRTTPIPGIPAANVQLLTEWLKFTYGSPRVGNTVFATFVTTQGAAANNFRVTHTDDPIPKVPSRSLGYLQWGPEYWIRSPTGQPVHANDIDVIPGTETPLGNSGTPPSFDIPAHLWYFNSVAACVLVPGEIGYDEYVSEFATISLQDENETKGLEIVPRIYKYPGAKFNVFERIPG